MLTIKQLRHPLVSRPWSGPSPKRTIQVLAITALTALIFPSVSAVISHQIQIEAAGGTSCLRVSADRKSQVRKYGADCSQ